MRRWAPGVKLLLFLLAGAIINVAVAWGCSYWVVGTREHVLVSMGHQSDCRAMLWSGFGSTRITWLERFNVGASDRRDFFSAKVPSASVPSWCRRFCDENVCEDARGWPLRCLWSYINRTPRFFDAKYEIPESEIELPARPPSQHSSIERLRVLPTKPIWKGFTFNTIFYAAMLWILFATPGALSRKRRRRRGECAACGYSLLGRGPQSENCPECGAGFGRTSTG